MNKKYQCEAVLNNICEYDFCDYHQPHSFIHETNKCFCYIKIRDIQVNKEYCNCYICIEKRLLGETDETQM